MISTFRKIRGTATTNRVSIQLRLHFQKVCHEDRGRIIWGHTPHERPDGIYQVDHLGLDARVVLHAAEGRLILRGTPADCV